MSDNIVINEVRPGFYLDSVALMRFSRAIAGLDGVAEAALMMGTPSNKDIMQTAGVLAEDGERASGGDLIIAIRAESPRAVDMALAEAGKLLERPTGGGGGGAWPARTLRAALKERPNANLALISVAGEFAVAEARKAIRSGLHAMIFSDNVPLADEVTLKQEARSLDRLVMGPDCGTAIINGVPLAFANKVKRGDIAIVGASGTGTQEICCLVDQLGRGISQAIGVGGRDLKQEVGGITTLMALDLLDDDPETSHVVIVSKPPADEVAARVLERVAQSPKTFTVCFLGADELDLPKNARFARTLKEAAYAAVGKDGPLAAFDATADAVAPAKAGAEVRGLFSGGTLCGEAQVVFRDAGLAVASNAPVPGASTLDSGDAAHRFIDLGDDEYTRGRPHPMIDPAVRDEALDVALADRRVGLLLVDLVIGYGAHDDPAGHLIASLAARDLGGRPVIASVTGTDADPQNRSAQIRRLVEAGIVVAPSNDDAARIALASIGA